MLLIDVQDNRDTLNSPELHKVVLGDFIARRLKIGLSTGHIRTYEFCKGLLTLEDFLEVLLDLCPSCRPLDLQAGDLLGETGSCL